MIKPIRMAAVLIIFAAFLPGMGSLFTTVFATQRPLAASPTLVGAASYSVLAGTTVTNNGPTTLSGDLGVSPGSAITGFPPGNVVAPGVIHAADGHSAAAQIDNTAAFGFLDQPCEVTYPGVQDLSLVSPLGPGVYCALGSFLVTGNLTLTGSGVWIFKSASTLITLPNSSVTGGDACNTWWMVNSSATLDTGTVFGGNILALTSIDLKSGASLNGRALAQTGAVTLDSNSISLTCAAAPTNTPTITPGPSPTPTNTPTSTPTITPGPSPTPTITPTATSTPPPTAVELLSFVASRHGQTVALNWATAAEVDNYGFNLYRANVDNFAQAELIRFEPSAIQGGTGGGATYGTQDTPPGQGTWWYWLADVDTQGVQTLHTPSVAVRSHFQIYLPWIGKN